MNVCFASLMLIMSELTYIHHEKKKIPEGTRIVSKKTERCLKGALMWYIQLSLFHFNFELLRTNL